ncbi:peptidase s9b dipeptidylpeptidase iv domain protein [Seiridium cupressi]
MRFQFDGQTWQYGQGGEPEPWHGDFDDGNFEKGCEEAPSPKLRQPSSITFKKHTIRPVSYSWIDNKGASIYYGTLAMGQTGTQQSYVGQIWRMATENPVKRVIFAVKDEPSIAVIEELPKILALRWETYMSDTLNKASDFAETLSAPEPALETFVRDSNV